MASPRRSPSPRKADNTTNPKSGASNPDAKCLFIGNLAFRMRDRDLWEIMDRVAKVKNVKIGINKRTGQSRGYAFVEFETRTDAETAYKSFQDYEIEGRRLRIDWDIGLDNKPAPVRRDPPPRDRDRGYDRGGYDDRGYGGGGGGGYRNYDRGYGGGGGYGGDGGGYGGRYGGGGGGGYGGGGRYGGGGYGGGGGRYGGYDDDRYRGRSRSPPRRRRDSPQYGERRTPSPRRGSRTPSPRRANSKSPNPNTRKRDRSPSPNQRGADRRSPSPKRLKS